MLKKDNKIERYIGGGKVYFTPKDGEEREIGEIQSASLSLDVETKDAMNYDDCMAKKSAKAVSAINGTIKFETNNINIENMNMYMLGKVENVAFATGDTLPDGSTATADTTIKCIKGATNPILEGSLKFIGDECGDIKPVLVIHNAVFTPDGDFNYIAEEWQKLGFSGEVLNTSKGYFDEYRMELK